MDFKGILKSLMLQQTLKPQLISYRKRPVGTGHSIYPFAWLFGRHPSDTTRSKLWLRKERNSCLLLYSSHAWVSNRFYSVMDRKLDLGIKKYSKEAGLPSLQS